MLLEACVEYPDDAVRAVSEGAGRIELCARLDIGGTTPSWAHLEDALARCRVPVFPLIRPRGGSAVYDARELDTIARDLATARRLGAPGAVIGVLRPDRKVDADAVARLCDVADGIPLTFHRAFDVTGDLTKSLETLVALGIARILTTGGLPSAWDGRDRLASLVKEAGDRIVIMPGGGIFPTHAAPLARFTGATELHVRATDAARFRAVATAVLGDRKPEH